MNALKVEKEIDDIFNQYKDAGISREDSVKIYQAKEQLEAVVAKKEFEDFEDAINIIASTLSEFGEQNGIPALMVPELTLDICSGIEELAKGNISEAAGMFGLVVISGIENVDLRKQ